MNVSIYVIYTCEDYDMAGLHDRFASYFTKYSNDDYDWVHFVYDHFRRMRSKAIYISLNPYQMNVMHYRLNDFLAEYNIPAEVDWIVLWLNQLQSEKDFKNLKWIFLPDMTDVQDLREENDTVTAHARSIITKS